MEPGCVQLTRLVIANYKSIQRLELAGSGGLTVLMGPNNAGKTNILDCLIFLRDAASDLAGAIALHGGCWEAIAHKKKSGVPAEVMMEFTLAEAWRLAAISRLFGRNGKAGSGLAQQSAFLSTLRLHVRLTGREFTEELLTPNLSAGAPPCMLFQAVGRADKVEHFAGQLDTLCARHAGDLPCEPLPLPHRVEDRTPVRLCLGQPEGSEAYPVAHELAQEVRQQLATLQWIDPVRHLARQNPIQGESHLNPDASNLADVLHWLYNNKPKQFRRLQAELGKLVPELGQLYTPTQNQATTLGLIEDEAEELTFTMDQMSMGTKSAVAIITKVLLTSPGAWLCIEEPETYLHPQAQVGLFSFLKDAARDRRIFLATHSTPVAAATSLESLLIIRRDPSGCTVASPITLREAPQVIAELGVQPTFDFNADAVVFVESRLEVAVFETWLRRYPARLAVQFLELEGGNTLQCLANLRIALSKHVHAQVYALFSRSAERGPDSRHTRQRLLQELKWPEEQMVTLDAEGVEGYLLESRAVLRAFPSLSLTEVQLEGHLMTLCRKEEAAGNLIEALRESLKLPLEAPAVGARIAAALEALPPQVAAFFERIELAAQPFWGV